MVNLAILSRKLSRIKPIKPPEKSPISDRTAYFDVKFVNFRLLVAKLVAQIQIK